MRLESSGFGSTLVFFSLPFSLLQGLLIWDLFKAGLRLKKTFPCWVKGTLLPLSHYTHIHKHTCSPKCLIPLSTLTWKGSYQTLKVSSFLFCALLFFLSLCRVRHPNPAMRTIQIVSTCVIGTEWIWKN